MSVKEEILDVLEELSRDEFHDFRWHLQQQPDILDGVSIPKSHLEEANRCETVDRIVGKHHQQSVKVVKDALRKIHRNDLAEKLSSSNTGAALRNAWEITKGQTGQFVNFLEKCGPQKLEKTVHVLNERIRMTECIQKLQERIKLIEHKQTEIKQTREALKKHEHEMKKNKEFTVEVDELGNEEFNKFKWFLWTSAAIPKSHLEEANRWETVDRIVEKHDQQSVKVVKNILKKIRRNDLEKLCFLETVNFPSDQCESAQSTQHHPFSHVVLAPSSGHYTNQQQQSLSHLLHDALIKHQL
uniref:Pyrin domain-containing protein n=1 Tax=Seriola dumerili TaxID=41447 RepID=A0A3B4VFJ3_SERDU